MKSYFSTTQVFTRANHPSNNPNYVPPVDTMPHPAKIQKKTLSEHIRHNFFRLLGRATTWEKPDTLLDGKRIKRVLLFRYDAIGDFIVSTPIIRWLATALPNVEIDIITSYRNDYLVSNDPFVHRTFPIYPGHNMHRSWIGGIRKTRPYNYDLILGLVFTRMTKCAFLASAIAPNAEKITILHEGRKDTYGLVFNRQVKHYDWREHWAPTMLRVATDSITPVTQPPNNVGKPYLALEEKAWRSALQLLEQHGLAYNLPTNGNILLGKRWTGAPPYARTGYPYCVVNISAYTKNRQWNSESCIALCNSLLASYNALRIFVTGAPDAKADIDSIVATVGNSRCFPLSVSLMEALSIVVGSTFVVTPDTATLHMAAASDKPILGLFAEYIKITEWYPYTDTPFVLLLSTNPHSINDIETETVVEAAHQLVQEAGLVSMLA